MKITFLIKVALGVIFTLLFYGCSSTPRTQSTEDILKQKMKDVLVSDFGNKISNLTVEQFLELKFDQVINEDFMEMLKATNPDLPETIYGAIILVANQDAANDCPELYAGVPSELRVDLVRDMIEGYRDHQLEAINSSNVSDINSEMGDARSIWFDFDTLREFLYHTEKAVVDATKDDLNKKTTKDLGFRFYYGRYPDAAGIDPSTGGNTWGNMYGNDLDDVPVKYQKLHTLVMVPTIRRNGYNYDFNFNDKVTYTDHLKGLPSYNVSGLGTTIPLLILATGSSGQTAQNHGSLIPPGLGLNTDIENHIGTFPLEPLGGN